MVSESVKPPMEWRLAEETLTIVLIMEHSLFQ
jgi:hypothetical protein